MRLKAVSIGLVVVGALLLLPPSGAPAARANDVPAPACAPQTAREVTVLARSGVGRSFTPLSGEGAAAPFLDAEQSRTIVPVRDLVLAMTGDPKSTIWDEGTRTAIFLRGPHSIAISIPFGQTRATRALVNGREVPIRAFICQDRLFAQAFVVAGALGAGIKFYGERTVVVDPAWGTTPMDDQVRTAVLRSEYQHRTAGRPTGTTPAPPDPSWCEPGDLDLADLFLSPAESAIKATRRAACQWVGGW